MKAGQRFALIMGIAFLLIGFMGFIPGLVHTPRVSNDLSGLGVANNYGYLLGVFPINVLHNIVHLTVGLLGILASIALDSSRVYGRVLFAFYGLLAIMGLAPVFNTTFGLIPIFGNDVWLHAITAGLGFYFGFLAEPRLLDISDRMPQSPQYTSTPSQG